MVFVSNFTVFFFFESQHFHKCIHYLHKQGAWWKHTDCTTLVTLSNLLHFLSLSVIYILMTFLILALLKSKSCFPPCYNVLNTDSQSASDAFLPSEVVIFSGTRGVWPWRSRWHLSILYKTGLLRSHTAGRFPARESPSCVAWYRLLPDGALVCRFWSRSDERSKTLQCSLMIVDRGLLHALRR